jgi:hypothetical protein
MKKAIVFSILWWVVVLELCVVSGMAGGNTRRLKHGDMSVRTISKIQTCYLSFDPPQCVVEYKEGGFGIMQETTVEVGGKFQVFYNTDYAAPTWNIFEPGDARLERMVECYEETL